MISLPTLRAAIAAEQLPARGDGGVAQRVDELHHHVDDRVGAERLDRGDEGRVALGAAAPRRCAPRRSARASPRPRTPRPSRSRSLAPRPSSVHSACTRPSGAEPERASFCSSGTTLVSPASTISCCAVSRHQPLGWPSHCTSVRRPAAQHARRGPRLEAVGDHAVDAAVADVLRVPVAVDDAAQVGARVGPGALLDDAVVQVADVEAAVGAGRAPHRAERRIGRGDELVVVVGVDQHALAVLDLDLGAAHQAADRFGQDVVALEVGGQAVAAEDRLAGAAGDVVERAAQRIDAAEAALHVDRLQAREDLGEALGLLTLEFERAVGGQLLEAEGAVLAARGRAEGAAEVVDRQAVLRAAAVERLRCPSGRRRRCGSAGCRPARCRGGCRGPTAGRCPGARGCPCCGRRRRPRPCSSATPSPSLSP